MLVYDNHEQAQLRLKGSVLTYEDKAVYVRDIRNATKTRGMLVDLTLFPLFDNLAHEVDKPGKLSVPIDDPLLNFRYFSVGYLNSPWNKRAEFYTRGTLRQQTQGLAPRQLLGDHGRMGVELAGCQAFEDMLFQKYPSPKEASQMLAEGWTSVGISQQWAIARDPALKSLYKLMYRNNPVGLALGSNFDTFQLEDEYTYLAEVLREENIPFTLGENNA